MIYIKLKKKPESIKELLTLFFSSELMDDRRLNVESYSNEECTDIQCDRNKLRSFDDILELVQTYFPSAEPKEVIHDLITLDLKTETGRELYPHLGDCSTINRIRFLYYKEYHYVEFCNIEKRNSKYSWKELLSLLEINNNSELEEYVKKHKKKNKECLVLDL